MSAPSVAVVGASVAAASWVMRLDRNTTTVPTSEVIFDAMTPPILVAVQMVGPRQRPVCRARRKWAKDPLGALAGAGAGLLVT